MAKEILFKAKRKDNGEWVEGYFLNVAKINAFICTGKIKLDGALKGIVAPEMHAVDQSTICQCTGLKDKNGKLIWENDILNRCNIVVKWKEELASYCLTKKGWMYQHFFGEAVDACDCEVVGNIFDNPELLETGKEAGKHGNQDILMPAT